MQYFAGREIFAGMGYRGWTAGFWPPLYSVLLGLGSVIAPGFLVGKAISMAAGTALLWVGYHLALELTHREAIAISSQVFLILTPLYAYESLQAHNHMLDAFLFISGLFLFLRALQRPSSGKWFVAGFVCGLAALTRYTSNMLLLLPVSFFFLDLGIKKAAQRALYFSLGFLALAAPWWFANARWNGSSFHTLEYLNTCAGIFRSQWHMHNLRMLWHGNATLPFEDIWDVFIAFPHLYLYNVKLNVLQSIPLLMKTAGVLGPFLIPSLLDGILRLPRRSWTILYGLWLSYVVVVSQAFEPDYIFLNWTVLSVILSVMLIWSFGERIEKKFPRLSGRRLPAVLLVVLALVGYQSTHFKVEDYATESSTDPLTSAHEVATALLQQDPHLKNRVVMASDPGWAYATGSQYLETPPEYEGLIADLVCYQGLSDKVRAYAPKAPSKMPLYTLHADYLIYTRTPPETPYWRLQEPPGFSFLLDPLSKEIPTNFRVIYRSAEVVAYRIEEAGAGKGDFPASSLGQER